MKRVLMIGGRLQKLLTDAQIEAEQMVKEAQDKAEEIISKAKIESNRKRARAQRGTGLEEMLAEEEEKAKKEAIKVTENFEKQAEKLKEIPNQKMAEAIDFVLKEVLPG
jgi:V/A-type H+-transporting ATPase subunit G/H